MKCGAVTTLHAPHRCVISRCLGHVHVGCCVMRCVCGGVVPPATAQGPCSLAQERNACRVHCSQQRHWYGDLTHDACAVNPADRYRASLFARSFSRVFILGHHHHHHHRRAANACVRTECVQRSMASFLGVNLPLITSGYSTRAYLSEKTTLSLKIPERAAEVSHIQLACGTESVVVLNAASFTLDAPYVVCLYCIVVCCTGRATD